MSNQLEMLRGTLDILILKTLSWGPAHGYSVAQWIEEVTGEELQVEEGSLYPALHRLEKRGCLESEWGLSENNRRAKYYRLTEEGRRSLQMGSRTWDRFARAISLVLNGSQPPGWAAAK